MTQKIDFYTATSESIVTSLCEQLEEIRLSRNISQQDLSEDAGVSRSTLTRMADGKAISLDSFVRIMQALKLHDHLAALLPDPGIRPVDRIKQGRERKRASRKPPSSSEWRWSDDD